MVLDLGGYFPVTELDILVPFGADDASGEPVIAPIRAIVHIFHQQIIDRRRRDMHYIAKDM